MQPLTAGYSPIFKLESDLALPEDDESEPNDLVSQWELTEVFDRPVKKFAKAKPLNTLDADCLETVEVLDKGLRSIDFPFLH